MGRTKSNNGSAKIERSRPASTLEAREQQIGYYALDLVEQRILNGTASSSEVCHFLKLISSTQVLEREKLRRETELLDAKAEMVKSTKRSEELYANALAAMQRYSGSYEKDIDDD